MVVLSCEQYGDSWICQRKPFALRLFCLFVNTYAPFQMWYSITMKNILNDTAVNVVYHFVIVIHKVTHLISFWGISICLLNPTRDVHCKYVLEKKSNWKKINGGFQQNLCFLLFSFSYETEDLWHLFFHNFVVSHKMCLINCPYKLKPLFRIVQLATSCYWAHEEVP